MKALLTVTGGLTDRKEYALEEGKTYLLGRSREADVIVKDRMASRNHCKVVAAPGEGWTVADLGSSNGTYVNRQRVTAHPLRDGDVLHVGKAIFEFRLTSAAPAPASAPVQVPQSPPSEAEETDTGQRPPAAEPRPAPRPEPAPAQAPASPAPAAGGEKVDEDLKDLFEFLDRIEGANEPGTKMETSPAPPSSPQAALRGERTPLPARAESPKPGQPPKAEEAGGLLAFLRKKKKP